MIELIWISAELALAIHGEQLAEHGGAEGVRDLGALESALARPQNLLSYSSRPPSIPALAAAYAYGIARNHPFVDGNKRTSLVVAETLLRLNGHKIVVSKEEKYLTYARLAEGTLSESELAAWFQKVLVAARNKPRHAT